MKKIPVLFQREFNQDHTFILTKEITPGFEWVLNGEGLATVKWDGAACCILNNVLYRRYDAKKGKIPPAGSILCDYPDPVTGHHPHWIPVSEDNSNDKWFIQAFLNYEHDNSIRKGTYEAIGPHFQANPYHLSEDILVPHGIDIIKDFPRTYEGIYEYFKNDTKIEGVVFWKNHKPQCKIRKKDYHLDWSGIIEDKSN